MSIKLSVHFESGPVFVHYDAEAKTKEEAHEIVKFFRESFAYPVIDISGVPTPDAVPENINPARAVAAIEAFKKQAKEEPKQEVKDKPTQEAKDKPKQFTRDEAAALILDLVKAGKKENAIEILQRHGMKQLPKDFADAAVLGSIGAAAELELGAS